MKIVFDTNVLIAAFIARGTCSELLEYASCYHELITSQYILKEFRETLITKFKMSKQDVAEAVRLLRTRMAIVTPNQIDATVIRDSSDLPVLGTAISGQCHCLISGDKELLKLRKYEGIDILSPADFWRYEMKQP